MKKVINIGGNNKDIALPPWYEGWEHVLLDIDASANPDIVCDARELSSLPGASYDSVYCSHNLEHYYRHDVKKVLAGFAHILKPDGFVYIVVPDIGELMRIVSKNNLDIDDTIYQSAVGPISVLDVIYGYGVEIEKSGVDFFAHKTGFTQKSLMGALAAGGFPVFYTSTKNLEVHALAFLTAPSRELKQLFGLPETP